MEFGLKLQLDKDLLVKGNKIYSRENCMFLPARVNSFLTNKQSNNTSGYTGYWNKRDNKWVAQIKIDGKKKHLGLFTDITLANKAYINARVLETVKIKQFLLDLNYSQEVIDLIK